MDVFDGLKLLWGLSLFLFGMQVMSKALEQRAGSRLQGLLQKLTGGRWTGLLTGLGVTAVIQSSSATTVMVVGFVNARLMELHQAVNVIMGANVGTTVTAWLLGLAGLSGDQLWVKLLKPSSFTPVLAVIGIVCYLAGRTDRSRDTGGILLGFATLMLGMETMSAAVSGLRSVPGVQQVLLWFSHPLLGVLAGAVLTAIVQSSSASVGILQALATTGQIRFSAAVPIIMGQNIGTCVTALLSSVGAQRNARRAAMVHLMFNVLGTAVWLTVFVLVQRFWPLVPAGESIDALGIALVHTVFNVLCTLLLLPWAKALERLAIALVPDRPEQTHPNEAALEERLLATPALALEQCRRVAGEMADCAARAVSLAVESLQHSQVENGAVILQLERQTDDLEEALSGYLIRLGSHNLSDWESAQVARLLHGIGDWERIADQAVLLHQAAQELWEKQLPLSSLARQELQVLTRAVSDCLPMARRAFDGQEGLALEVETLHQVISALKAQLRQRQIQRLSRGEWAPETGFVWADLLNSLERVSAHCADLARWGREEQLSGDDWDSLGQCAARYRLPE